MKSKCSLPKILAALALLAFSMPIPAFSQMMSKDHLDMSGDMMDSCIEHADKMELTDDQLKKMKPAHSEMQKKQVRFKADLKIAEIELTEIMEVKDFDLEKATAAAKKIAKIRADHHVEMIKGMKEMRTMLTDEQFKKMKTLMPKMHGEKKHTKRMIKK